MGHKVFGAQCDTSPELHTEEFHCNIPSGCLEGGAAICVTICVTRYTSNRRIKHIPREYGVPTISRLLTIIRLLCKRDLQKRLYSANETYDFQEPTNRSHPITYIPSGCPGGHLRDRIHGKNETNPPAMLLLARVLVGSLK